MENNNQIPDQPQGEEWLDEVLGSQELPAEIGPDEQAMRDAGLTHPDDLELEKIMAEVLQEDLPDEVLAEMPEDILDEVLEEIPEELPEDFLEVAPETVVAEPDVSELLPQEACTDETVCFVPAQEVETVEPAVVLQQQPEQPEIAEPEQPQDPKKIRKTRPKRKKGYGFFGLPHLAVTAVWLAIILLIGVTLGRTLWVCCADLMAFGKPNKSVTITITDEEVTDIGAIAKKLADAGLIDQPELFKFFAEFTGKKDDISAGTFTLNSALDYNAMIKQMAPMSPSREIVDDLMIPEGYNCAQIFALLEEKGVCTVAELEEYAANGELDEYWFLEGVERGDKYCLEGYLFPDTYDFYTNDDPERVLEKLLDAFDYRFTDLMKENFELMKQRYAEMLAKNGYGSDYIEANPLTLHQVVTVASIVQKEMANNAESYTIASVFYNRLTNLKEHPFLGSDATVYYAIGDYFGEKEELSQEDLDFDSPYNTRVSKGLPPGPICNPGVYGLYAALDPDDESYYYFIYSPMDGCHLFSKTLREHEALAEKLGY